MYTTDDRNTTLNIKLLHNFDTSLQLPQYETTNAAGADLRACFSNRDQLVVNPGERHLIPTGLAFEIPSGFEVQIRPRSGISLKTQLLVVNAPGTIDADYRGEVMIIIGNSGTKPEVIKHGTRIAQMVLAPVTQAKFNIITELSDTERGTGGFGSTGVR